MKILLNSIYPYAFAALFLILPFDEYARALPNIIMIILVLAFPFVIEKEDFLKIKKLPFFIFCAFALYLVLNAFFSGRFSENFGVINKVVLGLALFILYLPVRGIKKVNKTIMLSALAAILFSLYSIVVIINETGIFNIGNPLRSTGTLVIDRLYLGFLCVCSIVISFASMTKSYSEHNKYYLANGIINILFVLFIVSRYAIVALLLILLLKQLYGNKKVLKTGLVIIGIAFIGLVSYQLKDTLTKRFLYAEDYTTNASLIKNEKSFDQREQIWTCFSTIAKKRGILFSGLGFQGTKETLQSCYSAKILDFEIREWFLKKKYNTHNQFMDFYLSTGVFSLLLIVILCGVMFFKNRKHFIPTAFLIMMISFGMIENFFHRQIGAYYFGFILITLLIDHAVFLKSNSKKEALH